MKYRLLCQQFEIDWVGMRTDIKVAFTEDRILDLEIDKSKILIIVHKKFYPNEIQTIYKNAHLPFCYKGKIVKLI